MINKVIIYSRHPSHKELRGTIDAPKGYLPIVRFGSLTPSTKKVQINSVQAIEIAMNKLKMKEAFSKFEVSTPQWVKASDWNNQFEFPVVLKNIWGSRGTGNYLCNTLEDLQDLLKGKSSRIDNYIIEKYMNYAREYRVHVSTEGVFMMWRKLRRNDTPDNQRWFFNNQTCNWVGEEHELFNMSEEVKLNLSTECLKALNSVGLDFGACDVRINTTGRFSIIEINSAPSLGTIGIEKYKIEISKLINKKIR